MQLSYLLTSNFQPAVAAIPYMAIQATHMKHKVLEKTQCESLADRIKTLFSAKSCSSSLKLS